jgi:hypothetical protein
MSDYNCNILIASLDPINIENMSDKMVKFKTMLSIGVKNSNYSLLQAPTYVSYNSLGKDVIYERE